jgi:AcrR family transcriptional regulator
MSGMAEAASIHGQPVDGRRLRSERTKRRIVEAYLSLLATDSQIPTAAQIAERAGCSVRSIFERFSDLHALRVAATDHAFAEANAQAVPRDFGKDRQARIRSHVEMRAGTCARWLPMWRALNANQGESAELKGRIKLARELIMNRAELMYAPELAGLSPPERRSTLIALEALIDFESWARMRGLYGLSFEEACETWKKAIDRLLPPTPTVS